MIKRHPRKWVGQSAQQLDARANQGAQQLHAHVEMHVSRMGPGLGSALLLWSCCGRHHGGCSWS